MAPVVLVVLAALVPTVNMSSACHGEENEDTNEQGRVICVDASKIVAGKPKLVWKVDGIKAGFETPILLDGRLYVCDDKARLYCLDSKTGKQIWSKKYGIAARGSWSSRPGISQNLRGTRIAPGALYSAGHKVRV